MDGWLAGWLDGNASGTYHTPLPFRGGFDRAASTVAARRRALALLAFAPAALAARGGRRCPLTIFSLADASASNVFYFFSTLAFRLRGGDGFNHFLSVPMEN